MGKFCLKEDSSANGMENPKEKMTEIRKLLDFLFWLNWSPIQKLSDRDHQIRQSMQRNEGVRCREYPHTDATYS